MGRRSINTTKSGKYMNPTDQARKEARKKELKKNKKQRQMVRAAVLKNKDPSQILEEMEKIDEMEYNVLQPSPLNEKVLRDKRKKLKETFDRVMRLYHNDEPDHWADLKRKEVEYEKKRLKKQQYYESVKHAQSVQIDEIPLPSSTQTTTPSNTAAGVGSASNLAAYPASAKRLPPPPTALSLPPFAPGAPPGALKTSNDIGNKQQEGGTNENETKKKEPLGVPIGPSPDLQQMSDLDTDAEDNEVVLKKYVSKSKSNKIVPKPNSLQQRMLAISGQNIDDFMKEMENVHKKKELERSSGAKAETENTKEIIVEKNNQSDESDSDDSSNSDTEDSDPVQKRAKKESNTTKPSPTSITLPPAAQTQPPPMAIAIPPAHFPIGGLAPPPPIMFRPPPRPPAMHGFGIRMPPGPPPGPRGMGGMPRMRMPGPPPGLPPRMAQHHKNLNNKDNTKGVTTITAKPQIRNLSADVTRFVPSTLRVKREETTRKPNKSKSYAQEGQQQIETSNNAASKDDAYMQFMNEMQGLL